MKYRVHEGSAIVLLTSSMRRTAKGKQEADSTTSASNILRSSLQSGPILNARRVFRTANRRQSPNVRNVFAVEQLRYDPSVCTLPPAAIAVTDDSAKVDSSEMDRRIDGLSFRLSKQSLASCRVLTNCENLEWYDHCPVHYYSR